MLWSEFLLHRRCKWFLGDALAISSKQIAGAERNREIDLVETLADKTSNRCKTALVEA
jgi:hypothetical protein